MTDEQPQQQEQQPEDLDFIICLSFHKLQEQNHSLLPFVLIRNALTAQPQPQPSSPLIWTKEAEDEEMKDEQLEQQNWLDACFDDLEDEDSLMVDDFGDMMLRASAERVGIDPRQMPPFFFPLHHDKQDDDDSLPQHHQQQQQQAAYQHGDTRENDTNHMS